MKDFFVSYNKEDKDWAEWTAWTLEEKGYSVVLQAWDFLPGANFVLEMQRALLQTRRTIIILSESYLKAIYTQPEWAAVFARDPTGTNRSLIPLRVRKCEPEGLLGQIIYQDLVGLPEESAKNQILQALESRFKPEVQPPFPERTFIQQKKFPDETSSNTPVRVLDYFSESWPVTDPALFGRDGALTMLDEAWENPGVNIISLVAWGGVGKTTLVDWWRINRMQPVNWRGAERVLAWSFYNQGASEGQQASADQFIEVALRWFGDPVTAASTRSPWDKGLRLAELICEHKTLLLLDGLEPLQEAVDSSARRKGRLKDLALQSLLRTLAKGNPGLCVLTSRLKVDDLRPFEGVSVQAVDLEHLSIKASVEYLRYLQVEGTSDDLEEAAREFDGHALAITLLGSYVNVVHEGDIRQRSRIPRLTSDEKYGGHARRVMQSYEQWFVNKPELDILCLLGLFDRPAEQGPVGMLRNGTPILGLTDRIKKLSETQWKYALDNLRTARLLTGKVVTSNATGQLDCHPLVREYFGEKLRSQNPAAWREAHKRLYEYFKASPSRELPETPSELEPLYRAVAHGCQAGWFQETLNDVYKRRILRGEQYFSWKTFGNFGTELVALSTFFDHPWDYLAANLSEVDKGFIFNEVGFHLMALARLTEAEHPMRSALEVFKGEHDDKNAALSATNLCKLYLALGNLVKALACAEQHLALLADSRVSFPLVGLIVVKATILHQMGRLDEASDIFREAEAIHETLDPAYPLLYAFRGFRFCDLLLDKGDIHEIHPRIEQTLKAVRNKALPVFSLGIAHLTLGQTYFVLSQQGLTDGYSQAEEHTETAIDCLRRAGQQMHIISGLLSRAKLRRVKGDLIGAEQDVGEALDISVRGQMRRYECDVNLELCRVMLSASEDESLPGKKEITAREVRAHLEKIRLMVRDMNYYRREPEVMIETARLHLYLGERNLARQFLERAETHMNEMGCRRWSLEIQELRTDCK